MIPSPIHSLRWFIVCLSVSLAAVDAAPPWHYSGSGPWMPPSNYLGNVYPPPETAIPMEAIASESPLQISLKIYSTVAGTSYNPDLSGTYDIFRKGPDDLSWGAPIGTVTVGTAIATWVDTNVSVGQIYEYGLAPTGTTVMKFGNVLAGIKADRTLPRGRIAVVVASDILVQMPQEYAQYKADLVADGWVVNEIITPRAKDYTSNNLGTNLLSTVTVSNGGTGYTTAQDIVLSNGTVTALGTLTVNVSGVITAITVKHSASGFAAAQGLTMTGNTTGTGAVLAVNAVASTPPEHINIRNQLITLYTTYPGELKNVLLLGKVAVARSGVGYTGPDGHGNMASCGADAYYADMDGVWTDTGNNLNYYPPTGTPSQANATTDGRINIAGDNKFDATQMSEVTNPNSRLELGFGRVDFSNNVPGEYEALRLYFSKLHRYKTASPDFLPGRKAIMRGSFSVVTKEYLEGLTGVLGMSNLDFILSSDLPTLPDANFDADSVYTAQTAPYLFYFKGSGPPNYSEGGRAVFWTGMQSHWGYWYDSGISSLTNAMQRRVAEDNYCLSFTWSIGLQYLDTCFLYHRLGMGYDAGDMMRASVSNRRSASSLYVLADSPLFMNNIGDPALRLFMFPPPTNLSVVPAAGNPSLSWTAANPPAAGEPQVLGYHVYRAASANGPFTRITSTPVAGTTFADTAISSGTWNYMVRAVRLETTGGGTYYNASLGCQQSINLTGGPAALSVATTALPDANWSTSYQTSLAATGGTPTLNWTILSGALPPGLTLASSGKITGLASAGGTYAFTVRATDVLNQTADKALTLTAQSNNTGTFFAEANTHCTGYNTTKWSFYEPSLLCSGPAYLYQPFLRFDLSSLNTHNSFTRARLILTLDERSQPNSYALVKAALTQVAGENWTESAITYPTRPLDDTSVAPVLAFAYPVAFGTVEFDVTPLVRTALANDPARKFGVRLFTTLNNGFGSEVRFATRYASGNARPRLLIETTDAPAITITSPTANPASLYVGSSLMINATAAAIPANAASLTVQWSKVSGPGTVSFSPSTQGSTAASFPVAGDYVLRLTANDGVLTSTKDLSVRVLAVPATTSPVTGPTDSLILRLPFDDGAGTTATDVSGISPANPGALTTIGTTGNPTWVASGKVGGAINFDGGGQRVQISDTAANPLDGMQKLSASLWVKLTAADTTSHAILVKRTTSTASTTSYSLGINSSEQLTANVANKTAVTGDTILNVGQWYHVVMIYDGSLATNNLQLYLDGNPQKFGNVATGLAGNNIPRNVGTPLRVGDYTATAVTASFNGQVDEVRLYNRVLTLDEIQDLAQAKPSNMGPLITLASTASGNPNQPIPLSATVTDDGAFTTLWQKLSGPGTTIFSAPTSAITNVTHNQGGSYVLRLSASDGSITTIADVLTTISALPAFNQWALDNNLPTDGTGLGASTANPSGDGVSNAMKFVLGINVNTPGYGGRVSTGKMNVSGQDYLTLTFTRPEPVLGNAIYTVKTCSDLGSWSATETTEVSNSLSGNLRTVTVRDTQPMNGATANRFIRLEVSFP